MTANQIYNLFSYCGIMLLDNKLIMTSPDYFEEKTLAFLGKLGKDEFIEYPKIIYSYQKLQRTKHKRTKKWKLKILNIKYDKMFDKFEEDFWPEYCKIWNVDKDNYKLMNIINYLLNINWTKMSSLFDNFDLYFGDSDTISNKDLDYNVHPILLKYLDKNIDFDSRYIKLKSLEQ